MSIFCMHGWLIFYEWIHLPPSPQAIVGKLVGSSKILLMFLSAVSYLTSGKLNVGGLRIMTRSWNYTMSVGSIDKQHHCQFLQGPKMRWALWFSRKMLQPFLLNCLEQHSCLLALLYCKYMYSRLFLIHYMYPFCFRTWSLNTLRVVQ